MKRSAYLAAVLLSTFLAVPLFAANRTIVDDVIKMTKAGVAEDTIIAFVQKSDQRFDLSADDIIDLADAQVPRTVIKVMLDEADVRNDRDPNRKEDVAERPSRSTTVVVAPPYYPSYSYWDPFYDPYWYMPRFSLSLGFGGRYYRGGSYRGGHYGGHRGGGHSGGGHHGRH
ncbi:MAG TPA: hypothetical protein VFN10_07690 [Thermoanaerobaculia bacterium]|nr:hypothetical protein [Thermoanaerobaculia bacterium]